MLRIVRRVAKDRIISTVDPDARHGHKTAAKGFDGFKGHIVADPDSEIITDTAVTPGNAGDATVAEQLINDLVADSDRGGNGEVFGDCAYGTGASSSHLTITASCRGVRPSRSRHHRVGCSPKNTSRSTLRPTG